ncbi:MAG: MarR family transcriptional regulator [Pseudomonadota bacterium]
MKKKAEHSEQLILDMLDAAAIVERRLDSALSFSRGVSFSEYRLLRALQEANQGLTRVALAQSLSVTPSGVTRALKPLEKLGYVATVRNERDARQSLATLTDGGATLLADVSDVLADCYASLKLDQLSDSRLGAFEQVLVLLRSN